MASRQVAQGALKCTRRGARVRSRFHVGACSALLILCALATYAGRADAHRGTAKPEASRHTAPSHAAPSHPAPSHPATPPAGSWRRYKKQAWRRGYVTLENPGNRRRWTGYVLGPADSLLPKAERQIRAVLASWRTGRSEPIAPSLTRLIARVSDVFGGRTIRVVSGYRERSHAKDSHHKRGAALDFSIDGVPNWAVRDYLRSLRTTGVGYYPNSSFVHVDVRGYPAYWIDLSGPGAAPRYVAAR